MTSWSEPREDGQAHASGRWWSATQFVSLFVLTLVAMASLWVWRNFTIDDAFIGWRHGWNLWHHGSYSFNPSGARLDAATSTFYGMLASVPAAAGIDVVLFFKGISVLICLGFVWLGTKATSPPPVRWLFVIFAVGGPVQAVHIWGGLETGLYVLVATAVLAAALRLIVIGDKWFAALCAVLPIVRLEGALLVGVGLLLYLVSPHRPAGGTINRLRSVSADLLARWQILVVPALSVVAILLWRWFYFGNPLPNTFAAKSAMDDGSTASVVGLALANYPAFLMLFLGALVAALLAREELQDRLLVIIVVASAVTVIGYLPSELTMNYAGRFAFQSAWPVVLVSVLAMGALDARNLLLSVVVWLLPLSMTSPKALKDLVEYYPRLTEAHGELNQVFEEHLSEDALIVTGDVGLVPFGLQHQVLDLQFLGTDPALGVEGIALRIASLPTGALVLYAPGSEPDEVGTGLGQAKYLESAKRRGYRHVSSVAFRPNYWLQVWLSPDLARDPALVDALRRSRQASNRNLQERSWAESVSRWYWFR